MESLDRRWISFCFRAAAVVLVVVVSAIDARLICPDGVEFVAQTMEDSQRKDFLFYGVQANINDSSQCAKFCYETEFCRSAAYNPVKKHCELAYATFLKCQDTPTAHRTRSFQSIDQIVAVYCIRCPEGVIPATTEALDVVSDSTTKATTLSKEPIDFSTDEKDSCFVEFEQRALVKAAFVIEQNVSLRECKCKCANSWTSTSSGEKCRSFQYFFERRECVLNTLDRTGSSLNFVELTTDRGSYFDFTCGSDSGQRLLSTGYCDQFQPFAKSINQCYEQIDGFILNGLAARLQHEVSLEQCKCLCAQASEDFRCRSAMYYQQERDCVLNVDNRFNRSDLFRGSAVGNYHVSYLGLTCDGEALRSFQEENCRSLNIDSAQSTATTIAVTATVGVEFVDRSPSTGSIGGVLTGQLPPPGDKTDECFLEIDNFVLSDMAAVTEFNMTLDDCRCLCVNAPTRYNLVCLSIQYYANGGICLLNRKNRLQAPEKFQKVSSSVPHTYLDYLCSDSEVKRDDYRNKKCLPFSSTTSVPSSESTSISTTTTTTTTTATSTTTTATATPASVSNQTDSTVPETSSTTTTSTPTTSSTYSTTVFVSKSAHSATISTDFAVEGGSIGANDCRYGAFYESQFNGRRMLERIVVGDTSACFQSCARKHCRSVNILNFLGRYKYCEMFSDSNVDYPNANMITYNTASVYFDGVDCQPRN